MQSFETLLDSRSRSSPGQASFSGSDGLGTEGLEILFLSVGFWILGFISCFGFRI